MTDTIEQKALELVNAVRDKFGYASIERFSDASYVEMRQTLLRAIEAHEADKRRFSEAVQEAIEGCGHDSMKAGYIRAKFADFIIPKPDPLVEVLEDIEAGKLGYLGETCAQAADTIRAAIEKRGGKIVWGEGND